MKICIVSNSHPTNDVRLFYKLGHSLTQLGEVYIISTNGMVNRSVNPFQLVVESLSPHKALPELYQVAKEIRPDIVICVEPLTLLVGIMLKKRLKSKLIFDVHEFFADAYSERVAMPFKYLAGISYMNGLRWMAKHVDAITCVNQEILTQLLGSQSRSDKCLVLPNYPVKHVWDYRCDIPGALSQLCDMRFDLIYVGGLTRDRGIFKILKCATILKNEFPKLKILILGKFHDPACEEEFVQSINRFNLNAIIYYQPWIPAEKIGLLLKRSRFGLWIFNPQIKRMSLATPLKVLEYLAAGLPVITIKTPLMKALIEHNGLGTLSGYRSREIAASIAKMLKIPESEYQTLSKRCEDISENQFNWESLEPKLFELIRKLYES